MEKEPVLISACLLGVRCRYDGGGVVCENALKLREKYTLIPVCPEILGGLPTPRVPSECREGGVFTKDGADVTDCFKRGAAETLYLAELLGCRTAVFKERSPSCGCGVIYDGSFCGTLVSGNGITAELLLQNGIKIYGEGDIPLLLDTKK